MSVCRCPFRIQMCQREVKLFFKINGMLDKINDLYRGRQNLVFMRNNRFGAKHFSNKMQQRLKLGLNFQMTKMNKS